MSDTKTPSRLTISWREVLKLRNETLIAGLQRMNQATGRRYHGSRVREWERGDRHPDHVAARFMLLECVAPVIETVMNVHGSRVQLNVAMVKDIVDKLVP